MSKIQTPAFLNDLYRDLRDRRLLLPAAALLAALVAVPMLLSGSPQPAAVPPAPIVGADEATAVESAVLAEQPGIRDYRERLQASNSKDPFEQQFSPPEEEGAATSTAGSSTAAATSVPEAPAASSLSTGIDPSAGGGTGSPATPPPPTPGSAPASPQPGSPSGQAKRKLFTRVVDVTLGPLGETDSYENVRSTDLLPSNEDPILAYFGSSPNNKRAAFLLSAGVVFSDGDGECAPSPEECYYLRMKPGDERYLHYRPSSEDPDTEAETVVYRFKLRKIERKVIKGSGKKL